MLMRWKWLTSQKQIMLWVISTKRYSHWREELEAMPKVDTDYLLDDKYRTTAAQNASEPVNVF